MNYIRPCHVVLALLAGTLTAGPADAWNMGPMYCPSAPIDLVACNCGPTMPATPNIPRVMPGFRPMGAPVGSSDAARREQAKRTKIAKAILKKNPGRVISRPVLKAAVDKVAAAQAAAAAAAACEADPSCKANRVRLRKKYPNAPEEKIVAAAKRIVDHEVKPDPVVVSSPEPVPAPSTTVSAPPPPPATTEEATRLARVDSENKAWFASAQARMDAAKQKYAAKLQAYNKDQEQKLPRLVSDDGTVLYNGITWGNVADYNKAAHKVYRENLKKKADGGDKGAEQALIDDWNYDQGRDRSDGTYGPGFTPPLVAGTKTPPDPPSDNLADYQRTDTRYQY
jgi:hypothetical protein